MKVLNLYACLGGNRLLWDNCEVTAVELDEELAKLYQERFPNDKVIVADAHQYLLEHYKEYDFIWSSPPCPTHSRIRKTNTGEGERKSAATYPDMKLYEEIIFLDNFFKGKYCVENVKSYYEPLIKPQHIGRHYLWSNFIIPKIKQPKDDIGRMNGNRQKAHKKTIEERNAVNSELGLHILNRAVGIVKDNKVEQNKLF